MGRTHSGGPVPQIPWFSIEFHALDSTFSDNVARDMTLHLLFLGSLPLFPYQTQGASNHNDPLVGHERWLGHVAIDCLALTCLPILVSALRGMLRRLSRNLQCRIEQRIQIALRVFLSQWEVEGRSNRPLCDLIVYGDFSAIFVARAITSPLISRRGRPN